MRTILALLLAVLAIPAAAAIKGVQFNDSTRATLPTNLALRATSILMAPTAGAVGRVGMFLVSSNSPMTNSGASTTLLYTNFIPGHLLTNSGDAIRLSAFFSGNGGGTSLNLNGNSIGGTAYANLGWLEALIIRKGNTNCIALCRMFDGDAMTLSGMTLTENLAVIFGSGFGLSITGAGTVTGDVVLLSVRPELLPSP